MMLKRVLVVYRKSLYRLYVQEHQDVAVMRALADNDQHAQRLVRSHQAQQRALTIVEKTLRRLRLEATFRWRGKFRQTAKFDLIIALGGDGTVLDTAQRICDHTVLVGINSDPEGSVGHLCAGTATDLAALIDALRQGELVAERRMRLRVSVDGQAVLGPCLNDVLVAHRSPAEMTRLQVALVNVEQAALAGEKRIKQQAGLVRSSGLWVATATGSTAVLRSSGGKVMAPRSQRLQYRLRECYVPPPCALPIGTHGYVDRQQVLYVINRMRMGQIWADGPHRRYPLSYGQTVKIDRHPCALNLLPSLERAGLR